MLVFCCSFGAGFMMCKCWFSAAVLVLFLAGFMLQFWCWFGVVFAAFKVLLMFFLEPRHCFFRFSSRVLSIVCLSVCPCSLGMFVVIC